MAGSAREAIDWTWFTYARIAVLRELAAERTEREAADNLGVAYSTVRSTVEDIKLRLWFHENRELKVWWRAYGRDWHAWCGQHAGIAEVPS